MIFGISCDLQSYKTNYLVVIKSLYHKDLQPVNTYQLITIPQYANRNAKTAAHDKDEIISNSSKTLYQ